MLLYTDALVCPASPISAGIKLSAVDPPLHPHPHPAIVPWAAAGSAEDACFSRSSSILPSSASPSRHLQEEWVWSRDRKTLNYTADK